MKVYIAGKWEARERLKAQSERIKALGLTVTSSWLTKEDETSLPTHEDSRSYAERDLNEIEQADVLILDTFDETSRGGREVEYGFALASGVVVCIVGPYRNVFHHLVLNFETWDDCLDKLPLAEEFLTPPVAGVPLFGDN